MTARYIYAGSRRIAVIDATDAVYYYLNDHLGSAGVLLASDGTVRDKYRYKPFGGMESGQSVNVGQSYRYTGKPIDEELDMDWYYYGARYYDPEIGRFLSVDPLASKYPGWGPYVYCRNNPINLIDPTGMADNTVKYDDDSQRQADQSQPQNADQQNAQAVENALLDVGTAVGQAADQASEAASNPDPKKVAVLAGWPTIYGGVQM